MRKYLVAGLFGLSALILLHLFATPPAVTPTWTVQFPTAQGLKVGAIVEESGKPIGKVVAVKPHTSSDNGRGADVIVTLDPNGQQRLKASSTFLVAPSTSSSEPGLRLVVLDETSPMLPPGSHVKGADSELAIELKKQIAGLDSTVREVARQLDQFRGALDNVSKSEEKRKLEEGVEGLAATVRRVQDDVTRVVTQELARWKAIFEKIFPAEKEAEKTV
ncbi:MAG: MCE family protein [Deltaproteobacteria bacterium]|nr:MCE family protein [Deltaproteobacteria bacterium]